VELDVGTSLFTTVEKLAETSANLTTSMVVSSMNSSVYDIFVVYVPTYVDTVNRVESLLNNISTINDSYWYADVGVYPDIDGWIEYDYTELIYAIVNSLFVDFNIDPFSGSNNTDPESMQRDATTELNDRFVLVVRVIILTLPESLVTNLPAIVWIHVCDGRTCPDVDDDYVRRSQEAGVDALFHLPHRPFLPSWSGPLAGHRAEHQRRAQLELPSDTLAAAHHLLGLLRRPDPDARPRPIALVLQGQGEAQE
jgi:hypothetical protein